MPCRDWEGVPATTAYDNGLRAALDDERRHTQKIEAMLCAVLTVLESASTFGGVPLEGNAIAQMFDRIDYAEAGITRKDLSDWWHHHTAIDVTRRANEAAARERALLAQEHKDAVAKARAAAIAKLTPEEIRLLGY